MWRSVRRPVPAAPPPSPVPRVVPFKGSAARIVVVARSVPSSAAAEAAAGRAFGAGVARKVDAGAGRVLHDGGSAGTGGGGCARRRWRAMRSMRAMAVCFLDVGGCGYLIQLNCRSPVRRCSPESCRHRTAARAQ